VFKLGNVGSPARGSRPVQPASNPSFCAHCNKW
jgi:hypothetical protein